MVYSKKLSLQLMFDNTNSNISLNNNIYKVLYSSDFTTEISQDQYK